MGGQNSSYYIGFIGIPDGGLYTIPWGLDGDWFREQSVYMGDRSVDITLVL